MSFIARIWVLELLGSVLNEEELNEEIKNFVKNRIFLYVIIMQYCDVFFQNELIYSIFIDC